MLTWNLFERRFGGDPAIVGRQIHLDGKPYTVVGVLPKWFTYPDAKVQVWVPYASGLPPAILQHHDFHFSHVVARLRPDVSLASALSQVEAVQYRLHLQIPECAGGRGRGIQDPHPGSSTRCEEAVDHPVVRCRLHAADRLPECRQPAGGAVRREAEGNRHPERAGSAEDDADSRTVGGEPTDLDCRRRERSAVIAGGYEVAGQHVEGSSQRAEYPRRRRGAGVRLRARLCIGVAGRSAAGDLLDRQGSDGGAAGFVAERRQAAGRGPRCARRCLRWRLRSTVVLLIAAGLLLKSFWRLRSDGCGLRDRQRADDELQPPRKDIRQPREGERVQRNAAGAACAPCQAYALSRSGQSFQERDPASGMTSRFPSIRPSQPARRCPTRCTERPTPDTSAHCRYRC